MADATVGGASAAAQGGEFWRGFAFSGIGSGSEYAYRSVVGYRTEWAPGGKPVSKGRFTRPVYGADNVGFAIDQSANLSFWDSVWGEGHGLSRVLGKIPGINAVAGMHDIWQISTTGLFPGSRGLLNLPGMPIAALPAYGALMQGVPAVTTSLEDR